MKESSYYRFTSFVLIAVLTITQFLPVFSPVLYADDAVEATSTDEGLPVSSGPAPTTPEVIEEKVIEETLNDDPEIPMSSGPATGTPATIDEIISATSTPVAPATSTPATSTPATSTPTVSGGGSTSDDNTVETATTSDLSRLGSSLTVSGSAATDIEPPPVFETHSTSTAATTTATTTDEVDDVATSTLDVASSTPTIVSGRAVAMANILNILNTNLVNSEGMLFLGNYFNEQTGTLDLRGASSSNACPLLSCQDVDGVRVQLLNDAKINNVIAVTATSGDNQIDGGGDATIETGDAYAGLNVVNVANTNFVDSNYLLVSLNAFQNMNGDIVFPGLSNLFSPTAATTQNITNSAAINNNVDVTSSSGNNSTDSASSTIQSGNSSSNSNVFNSINTSLTGGNTVHILLRVHGTWTGEVFGAPDFLHRDISNSTFFMTNGTSTGIDNFAINATNTAEIHNDISVSASTGDNRITGANTARITTGNAYAGANLINVANANVIGRNWILAIINIFGDFNGNLAFGRPDLWVGEQVSTPAEINNGTEVTYKFTVINNGDSVSNNVVLADSYDSAHIEVTGSSHEYKVEGGKLVWSIGTLPPGGATEISYTGKVRNAPAATDIVNTVRVSGRETDNNMADNTDTATIRTSGVNGGTWSRGYYNPAAFKNTPPGSPLYMTKVTRVTQAASVDGVGTKVPQELVIYNPTDYPIRSVVLYDTLTDPSGEQVQREQWKIGDIKPYEEVRLEYDIQFGKKALPGFYTLSTRLEGTASSTQTFANNGSINLVLKPALIANLKPKQVPMPIDESEIIFEESTSTVSVIDEGTVQAVHADTGNLVAAASESGNGFDKYLALLVTSFIAMIAAGIKTYEWLT